MAFPVAKPKRRHGYVYDHERVEREKRERAAKAEADAIAEYDAYPESEGLCYFIGCDEGLVKIGYSRSVGRRLGNLRSTSIYKLRLMATARGGRDREMHYHRRFAEHRFSGEWFELHPDILAEIDRLASPTPSSEVRHGPR